MAKAGKMLKHVSSIREYTSCYNYSPLENSRVYRKKRMIFFNRGQYSHMGSYGEN